MHPRVPPGHRPARLTQLEPGQATAMLGSCDAGTAAALRDLAMLTLLARLGLRAGEVAALSLDDLDWRAGEITVTGKGRRSERLPLPAAPGSAPGGGPAPRPGGCAPSAAGAGLAADRRPGRRPGSHR
jgi:integrase/recombinase XerD